MAGESLARDATRARRAWSAVGTTRRSCKPTPPTRPAHRQRESTLLTGAARCQCRRTLHLVIRSSVVVRSPHPRKGSTAFGLDLHGKRSWSMDRALMRRRDLVAHDMEPHESHCREVHKARWLRNRARSSGHRRVRGEGRDGVLGQRDLGCGEPCTDGYPDKATGRGVSRHTNAQNLASRSEQAVLALRSFTARDVAPRPGHSLSLTTRKPQASATA
jgi:hypothetical protein